MQACKSFCNKPNSSHNAFCFVPVNWARGAVRCGLIGIKREKYVSVWMVVIWSVLFGVSEQVQRAD